MRPRALIFGAGGLLAHELGPALARAGFDVVGATRAMCDVTNASAVDAQVASSAPALVVNCAAYTRVDDAERHEDLAFSINALGARHVAQAAERHGATLVHLSTDYVFDGEKRAPYLEHDAVRALGAYARTKLAGEEAVREVGGRHYLVRTGELYGDGGPSFFATVLARARSGAPLRVVDDQVVAPTWTRELAAQLVTLVTQGPPGLYHAACDGAVSWHGAAMTALSICGIDARVEAVSSEAYGSPAPRPRYSVLAHQALDKLGLYRMRRWDAALAEWLLSR